MSSSLMPWRKRASERAEATPDGVCGLGDGKAGEHKLQIRAGHDSEAGIVVPVVGIGHDVERAGVDHRDHVRVPHSLRRRSSRSWETLV
jgi:hypothetical protein